MNRRKREREREMRWLISWVYTGGAEKREREGKNSCCISIDNDDNNKWKKKNI